MKLKYFGTLFISLLLCLNYACKKKAKESEPAQGPVTINNRTYGEFFVIKRQLCVGTTLVPTWQYNRAVLDWDGKDGYLFWGYYTYQVDSIRLNSTPISLLQGLNYCDSSTVDPPYTWKISNSDSHFPGFTQTVSGSPQSITGAYLPDTVYASKNTTIKLTGTANADEVWVSFQYGFGTSNYIMSVSDDSLSLSANSIITGTCNIQVTAFKNTEVRLNDKKFIFRVGHCVEKDNVVIKP
jgi:hypothetical protein